MVRSLDSIPPPRGMRFVSDLHRCTRSRMRHQRAHYGLIAWGAGKDDRASTCRWNFLGTRWADAARQITTLCKFRFVFVPPLLSSWFTRTPFHLEPGEEEEEEGKKGMGRVMGFFSAGTGPVPNMADLSKDASRLEGEICYDPFKVFLFFFLFLERKGAREIPRFWNPCIIKVWIYIYGN